jgi:hypothetical protein
MITYRSLISFPGIKIPVLHRVVYARTIEGIFPPDARSDRDRLIDTWLKSNCRYNYYRDPGYLREKFIEFECDEEAMLFALKWV